MHRRGLGHRQLRLIERVLCRSLQHHRAFVASELCVLARVICAAGNGQRRGCGRQDLDALRGVGVRCDHGACSPATHDARIVT